MPLGRLRAAANLYRRLAGAAHFSLRTMSLLPLHSFDAAEAGPSTYAAAQNAETSTSVSHNDTNNGQAIQSLADSDVVSVHNPASQPLSKNAQKRLLKRERFELQKAERRARDKEKKKEKRARVREESQLRATGQETKPRQKAVPQHRTPFGAAVCIDLGFDELMTDKEITSMSSQISFVYASNKRSCVPFSRLIFAGAGRQRASQYITASSPVEDRRTSAFEDADTSASATEALPLAAGPTGTRMTSAWKWEEWRNIERIPHGGLASLFQHKADAGVNPLRAPESSSKDVPSVETSIHDQSPSVGGGMTEASGDQPESGNASEAKIFDPQDVIYLTADADETLSVLETGKLYVVGGLVDRNRHKNICLRKARALGIKAARLPIDEEHLGHRALNSRKVLTVNQVFDILLGWTETRDWASALDRGVPGRKFAEETKSQKRARLAYMSFAAEPEPGAFVPQLVPDQNEHEAPVCHPSRTLTPIDDDELYNASKDIQ